MAFLTDFENVHDVWLIDLVVDRRITASHITLTHQDNFCLHHLGEVDGTVSKAATRDRGLRWAHAHVSARTSALLGLLANLSGLEKDGAHSVVDERPIT